MKPDVRLLDKQFHGTVQNAEMDRLQVQIQVITALPLFNEADAVFRFGIDVASAADAARLMPDRVEHRLEGLQDLGEFFRRHANPDTGLDHEHPLESEQAAFSDKGLHLDLINRWQLTCQP